MGSSVAGGIQKDEESVRDPKHGLFVHNSALLSCSSGLWLLDDFSLEEVAHAFHFG